jgi:hypothetical protein
MNRNSQIATTLSILSLATIAVAMSSCGGNSDKPGASPTPQKQQVKAPAWKVSLKSACAGVTDGSCKGQYGFSIDANGSYLIGPAPSGQTLTGQIAADKLADIAAKVNAFGNLSTASAGAENCQLVAEDADAATIAAAADTLTLTQQSGDKVLLLAKDNSSCYEVSDTSAVDGLHHAMSALENASYPAIFPDACSDSVALLQQEYASVQGCSTDTDCTYYNVNLSGDAPTFDVTTSGAVFTDSVYGSCSMISPLVVANSAQLSASTDALAKAIQASLTACQDRQPADCTAATLDASLAPSCVHNVCTLNAGTASAAPAAPATGSAQLR